MHIHIAYTEQGKPLKPVATIVPVDDNRVQNTLDVIKGDVRRVVGKWVCILYAYHVSVSTCVCMLLFCTFQLTIIVLCVCGWSLCDCLISALY